MPTDDLTFFLIGGAIGLFSAVVGAIFDYYVNQPRNQRQENEPPGCMFIVAGSLGFAGLIAIVLSLLFTRSIRMAAVTGLGVLLGFFIGFSVLFIAAIVWSGKEK